jgi:hypothetical protein
LLYYLTFLGALFDFFSFLGEADFFNFSGVFDLDFLIFFSMDFAFLALMGLTAFLDYFFKFFTFLIVFF